MIAIAMLSLAGIPPLPGFIAKFLIFKNVIAAGYVTLCRAGLGRQLPRHLFLPACDPVHVHEPGRNRRRDALFRRGGSRFGAGMSCLVPAVALAHIPGLGDHPAMTPRKASSCTNESSFQPSGSPLARKAIKTGVALAKSLGASVVGYTAVEPVERIHYS